MTINESELRTILDLSPICNKIIDTEGKLQYMSKAGVSGLKIANIEEFYGKEYPVSFFPDEVRSNLRDYCRRALNGESCSIEAPAIDTEAGEIWFSTTFVPVFNQSGKVKFVIAASVDISEEMRYRKHLEQLVLERTKEKVDLQQQLFLAQKTKAIGSLAAGIAHDFNNVLSIIQGIMELQKHKFEVGDFSVESLGECATDVTNAVNRAKQLCCQLTGFAGKEKYDARPTDVNLLVDELDNLFRKGLTSTRKVNFKTDLQAKSFVKADAGQIHQVIHNLMVNSRDAMPNGGEILVSTKDVVVDKDRMCYGGTIPAGKYVVISVRDHGVGMNEEILGNIFDPFFSTKTRESGTGLGLASVWGIVENHNGHVVVQSELDMGTEVDVYFPAIAPVGVENIQQKVIRNQELAGRVLVVDDEEIIRNVIRDYLTAFGVEVVLASNGEEALRIYKSENIDLVITDLVMDPIDGMELYFEIRRINADADVYITSGYHEDEKVKKVLEDGARGFLKKPFRLAELKDAVQESMRTRV